LLGDLLCGPTGLLDGLINDGGLRTLPVPGVDKVRGTFLARWKHDAEAYGNIPSRFCGGLPQPRLRGKNDVPHSPALINNIRRALRVPAGDEKGDVRLKAPARTLLVSQYHVGEVDLVYYLGVLLRPFYLLHRANKVAVRVLVPIADVQLPVSGR